MHGMAVLRLGADEEMTAPSSMLVRAASKGPSRTPGGCQRRVRSMEIVELEFGLHRRDAETYTVELRVSRPDSDAETRVSSRFPVGQIDLEAIRRHKFDVEALGLLLAEWLFADSKLRTAFAE